MNAIGMKLKPTEADIYRPVEFCPVAVFLVHCVHSSMEYWLVIYVM